MGKTSNSSKQKYNSRVYKQVNVALSRDLVEAWEYSLATDGITKADFIRNSLTQHLNAKGILYNKKVEG